LESAKGRTIGYYQASNVRQRACNKIAPADIYKDCNTHLYFAFASIDPGTFHITPASSDDIPLYTQFTALKSSTMQTWIAIGGFDFSDPGPTHTAWSDLCADAGRRATFISSVISFMNTYGLQGVDIDWEYPGDSTRGGTPADTANFVLLVQEMRAAFGTSYGLSLTLAPDY
jgi:chitinase